ncbi:MAG: SDR family oxidoreductase [Thermoguttaceae bacterium]|jgi:short-subunit dehydrogenase
MARETVLITGASSGIGLALAKLFAADKSDLVLVARNQAALENLAEELRRDHGGDVLVEPNDLADAAAPQAIFDHLTAKGITVDVVVNNAGFGSLGAFTNLPAQRQLDMIQVNVAALTHLSRLFLPGMIERGRGGILNVGSTAGFQPGPNMAVYYAAKAYVLSFTEALAEELAGTKIKVTCLAPGPTATGFAALARMENALLFRLGAMDAKSVASVGYRGFRRGKVLVIPGFRNKLGTFAVRLGPRLLVRKIVKRLQS